MFKIEYSTRMKRDIKRMEKRGKDMKKLINVLNLLSLGEPLPKQYRDHALTGNWKGTRECHIEPDWLLVYYYMEGIIVFARTGTHSDLFR